ASEYLSAGLVQFARATDSYFSLGNKFRNPTVAPTHDVTTERSRRLQLRFVPVDKEDTQYTYKTRFQLTVGDNRVLDMGSTYFDIRGVIDRGPSFKPYSGTAYNNLAPRSAPNNCFFKNDNGGHPDVAYAQLPFVGTREQQNLMVLNAEGQRVAADPIYQPEPQYGVDAWPQNRLGDFNAGRALKSDVTHL
ncbi:hexon, partial [Bovine adenovirus 10]